MHSTDGLVEGTRQDTAHSDLLTSPRSVDSGEGGVEDVASWVWTGSSAEVSVQSGLADEALSRARRRHSHALLWLMVKGKSGRTNKTAKQPTWQSEAAAPRHARARTEGDALERTKSFRGSTGVNLELVRASACHRRASQVVLATLLKAGYPAFGPERSGWWCSGRVQGSARAS
ncbi:hypothetical protein M409DRAFT_51927 [Zasmidium cellare ATCC 36951]|uniref:Uncharacterized protein n=1 Tax=Zasmidium cellare ATCC 36951 TaxID=1080233 RepID=A0A6A6CSC2_ZASCE|nr:uncharacterized protein M409DRAFT_51927 [Zasmidium cellare ATCC 36951]KAF2170177.1 hypothetical protein M409DRAFT_51927 [Zasmidium cellare ATCC 36951]